MNKSEIIMGQAVFALQTPLSAWLEEQPLQFVCEKAPAMFEIRRYAPAVSEDTVTDAPASVAAVSVRESDAVRIAGKNPGLLVQWLHEGALADWGIATVCDVLGRECSDTILVLDALGPVLDHPKAYVREAAVLGLRNHIDSFNVQELLRETLESEPASEVKLAIESALRLA